MPGYRRNSYRKRSYSRGGRNTRYQRTGKLVNGHVPMTYPERLLREGAPYAKMIPALTKTVGMFAKMINSEVHYHDVTATGTTIDNVGNVILLSGMAQGDTSITREGSSILAKDLSYRLHLGLHSDAVLNQIRLIFFVDKQQNGATPLVGEILQTVSYLSPLDLDNGKRFVVLKDQLVTMDSSSRKNMVQKGFLKLPFHLKYDGATGGIADMKENAIFLLVLSDAGSNYPTIDYYTRFKWYDN